jgi:outer membrane protein assembly factor BamB
VYFDTTDTLLLVSTATGTLTGSVTIPASALPGAHSITAIGRHSGDAAQHALSVSTPWAQFGYGAANNGVNPYENVLSTATVPALGTLWESTIGTLGGTPAVVNGRVYVNTANGVASLNAATGAIIWNKNYGETFEASPTVVGATIYIGDLAGFFYAINAANGAILWQVTLNGPIYSSATVVNGVIYVGTAQGTMYALNAANKGQVVWSYTAATGEAITVKPAVSNGNVYFAAYNGYIYCVSAASGTFVWKYLVGNAIDSSPAVVNGMLYIASYDEKVYAISTAPGTAGVLQWSYTTGSGISASPAVANGYVYIGSGDGNLYALNARTGAVYFSLATGGSVRSAVVANGVIYFTTSLSTAFAINQYGSVMASGSTGNTFLGSPSVSDGRVFIGTTGGGLFAFAPNGGSDVVRAYTPSPSSLHPNTNLQVTR